MLLTQSLKRQVHTPLFIAVLACLLVAPCFAARPLQGIYATLASAVRLKAHVGMRRARASEYLCIVVVRGLLATLNCPAEKALQCRIRQSAHQYTFLLESP